ncbi:CRISPR-associated endonuclease Cas3'' [Methanogenium cariaci]|uniref:CRISPR-associated endonuclease Cas3'' n=1 Tax=Methanogenium cariaci TaxID=2197 RepID=UPI001FDF8C4D|nr:CRISPR-associated endonuclease Cas3'' [Methanogenium cariaci]
MYYAHTTEKEDKSDWQTLEEHLKNVAEISSAFAKDFNAGEFAYAGGGLLHDIGKYSPPEFQQKLEGRNIRVDHSTAGAREAGSLYPPLMNRFLEYIIAGHHGGIPPNYGTKVKGLERRIHSADLYDYRAYKNKITTPELDPGHFNLTFGEKIRDLPVHFTYGCCIPALLMQTH